jgi:perosamine synthetase
VPDATRVPVADILARLAIVLCPDGRPLALHEPELGGHAWAYVKQCLDDAQVSSAGAFVTRFEQDLATLTGARHAVATVNGTAALHIALRLAGVAAGDEVLVPALSFVAAANAARYCGATPHFIDTDAQTLTLDVPALAAHLTRIAERRGGTCVNRATGRRIAAVVALHAFGHPVDLDAVLELCDRFDLPLVEDAAQALGSRYKGRHVGTAGRIGILSFNGNKIVTTGGGGAILTSDAALADEATHLTTTARVPHPWTVSHDRLAYNYRLPSLNAALGCAQLEELPGKLQRKRLLADRYMTAFAGASGARIFREPEFATSNYWLNLLVLEDATAESRDAVLAATHAAGILTRSAWTPMHRLPQFLGCPGMDLRGAERLLLRIVALPSSPALIGRAAGAPHAAPSG